MNEKERVKADFVSKKQHLDSKKKTQFIREAKTIGALNKGMLDLEKIFEQMQKNLADLLLDKDIKAFYLTSVKRDKEEIAKLRRMVDSQRAELTRVNSQLQQKVNKINEVLLVFSNLSSAYENRLAGFFAKSISDFLQTLPDTPLNMSEL
jgi:uncharacterized coiled-coil protein SlyX